MTSILKLVDYSDPILRQVTERVTFPLSVEDKQLIIDMKYSLQAAQLKKANAPWESAAGMAANQWGINKQIFLFCPFGNAKNVEVIINPSYTPLAEETSTQPSQDLAWEGCFSVPLTIGNVERYKKILVTYQTESGEQVTRTLSGWEARVWQHENDHLNGLLYDDLNSGKCKDRRQFATKKELEAFSRD